MTETVTCAADLADHPEFKAFLGFWQRDKRCPLALPDWLRDHDLWRQAEVAEWAVNAPALPSHYVERYDEQGRYGPTPMKLTNGYEWLCKASMEARHEYDILPGVPVEHSPLRCWGMTFTQAIVALLDHYQMETP